MPSPLFDHALRATLLDDADSLDALLAQSPELAREGGSRERGAGSLTGVPAALASRSLVSQASVSLLHRACEAGSFACARLLLSSGADPSAVDATGKRLSNPLFALLCRAAAPASLRKPEAPYVQLARALRAKGADFPWGASDALDLMASLAEAGRLALAELCAEWGGLGGGAPKELDRAAACLARCASVGPRATRFALARVRREALLRPLPEQPAPRPGKDPASLLELASFGGASFEWIGECLDALREAGAPLEASPAWAARLRALNGRNEPAAAWFDRALARRESLELAGALAPSEGASAAPAAGRRL
jgi:hypothetical protein